jgi:hypothetical protein
MEMGRAGSHDALHLAPVRAPLKSAERAAVAVIVEAYAEELDQARHPHRDITRLGIGPVGKAVAGIDEAEHAAKAEFPQHLQAVAGAGELNALPAEFRLRERPVQIGFVRRKLVRAVQHVRVATAKGNPGSVDGSAAMPREIAALPRTPALVEIDSVLERHVVEQCAEAREICGASMNSSSMAAPEFSTGRSRSRLNTTRR